MEIPEGFALVQHFFTGAGLPLGGAVTYGVDLIATPEPIDVAECAHGSFVGRWNDVAGSSYTCSSTRVKFGPNEDGPFAEFVDPGAGTVAGAVTVPNTAVLIRKVTGLGGRRGQGRMYIPGLLETDIGDNGNMTATRQGLWQTAIDLFLSDLEACVDIGGMQLLHSASSPEVEDPTPVPDPTPVTSLVVNQTVATQRRRLRR